jgi:hypothetical protein
MPPLTYGNKAAPDGVITIQEKMSKHIEQFPGQVERTLMIHYRRHALRVNVGAEIRFFTEDIVRIAGIRSSARLCEAPGVRGMDAGALDLPETLGWSQALKLLDCGDPDSVELQRFGEWMLAGAIEQLCGDQALTGTELLDTSTAHESSFFRRALQRVDASRCGGSPLSH